MLALFGRRLAYSAGWQAPFPPNGRQANNKRLLRVVGHVALLAILYYRCGLPHTNAVTPVRAAQAHAVLRLVVHVHPELSPPRRLRLARSLRVCREGLRRN